MLGSDRPPARCPTCNAPLTGDGVDPRKAPFCSDRCKLVDLSRWLSEDYRVPGSRVGDGAAFDPQAIDAIDRLDDFDLAKALDALGEGEDL
ncbi:MAG TPA: DNA gyrase inhibitor YacG [Myxococcota bacterium]|nr:DNA gyrase inhibitor YacG [Myxococcota bacterium]